MYITPGLLAWHRSIRSTAHSVTWNSRSLKKDNEHPHRITAFVCLFIDWHCICTHPSCLVSSLHSGLRPTPFFSPKKEKEFFDKAQRLVVAWVTGLVFYYSGGNKQRAAGSFSTAPNCRQSSHGEYESSWLHHRHTHQIIHSLARSFLLLFFLFVFSV